MKMMFLSLLVCFSSLLQATLSAEILAAKPKPVELKYSCMAVIPAEHQDQRPDNVPIILLHGLSGKKESWSGIFELLALDTKKEPESVEKIIVEDMTPNGLTPEALNVVKFFSKMITELEKDIPQGVTTIEAKKVVLKLMNERIQKINPSWVMDDLNFVPIKCSDGKCQWATNPVLYESILRNFDEIWNESSGRFDGPALFIYGGKSEFRVGDDESNIKKLFPNAKLVVVAEAEHMVHTFKKFTREVIKFINDK